MLAIDIETMGLDKNNIKCPITMVCVYDKTHNIERSYPFLQCVDPESGMVIDPIAFKEMSQDLICCLNKTDRIASYNGVLFDLPFIAAKLEVPNDILASWILKSVDVFYSVKCILNQHFKMRDILALNGLSQKSADGLQAIEWAKQQRTSELQTYCMQDTKLAWQLSSMTRVIIPTKKSPDKKFIVWSNNTFCIYK